MTPTPDQTVPGGLVQRIEVLLASLTGVVSARVILDEEKGAQVHIIATSELPVSEVSRAVMSTLTWGLGLEVPSNQITVVQSRLSHEELRFLLTSETADPSLAPVEPETADPPPVPFHQTPVDDKWLTDRAFSPPPAEIEPETADPPPAPVEPETADPPPATVEPVTADPPPAPVEPVTADTTPTPIVPESPPTGSPAPKPSVPHTGLLEFSLGGTYGETKSASELDLRYRRLQLQDLQVNRNTQGGFGIFVRLSDNDRSIGAQREAAGTEEDALEVPACAALGVIQEFLRTGREDGLSVVLRFLAARRLRHPQHDLVVVLVELESGGRKIPLTGAASANGGVEKASILATLQATNAFVTGTLTAASLNGDFPQ